MNLQKELGINEGMINCIISDYKKLKPYEACLIGNVIAIMKRSDSFLEKPEHLVNHNNDCIYVVFEPTELAKTCGLSSDVICNKDSQIKFISIETLALKL